MLRRVIRVGGHVYGTGLRNFRTSSVPLNKLPLSILDILKEPPPSPKKQKKILILSPEETKDKALSKYVADVSKSSRKKLTPRLIQLEDSDNAEPNNFTRAIDHFKPEDSISIYRASAIVEDLARSFTKAQLVQYVKSHGLRTGRGTKQQLAETIVHKIWNSEIPGNFPKGKRLILSEESVPLTKFEMFLLLSQKGAILRNVRSAVSKFGFDKEKAELVMAGTEHQLENARILLQSRLERYYKEELDLASLKKLYLEKYGEFSFKEIGKNTEVYFNHMDADKYELAALNPNQVKRIRRLLLWHLDYNLHKKDFLHLPNSDDLSSATLLPYNDDYAFSWKDRFKKHRVLKRDSVVPSENRSFKEELEKFSDENLNKFDSVLDYGFDEPATLTDSTLSDKTLELLESLGIMDTDPEIKEEAVATEASSGSVELLSQEKKDLIYAQLTDFDYVSKLKGVEKEQLDEPVFTISLGNVLFESQLSELVGTPATAELQKAQYKFNTNVPLVYDELLSSSDLQDIDLLSNDPHDYSLQFKFTPSPFVEEFKDSSLERTVDEQVKYPPIEVWMQLNNRSVPDIETVQAVTVEGENSCFVCCPGANADIKVSCQQTGRVLSDEAAESEEGNSQQLLVPDAENEGLQQLLESTTSKYARVENQPGIREFLRQSELDFSGRKPTSIAPVCDFVIAGQKVRYNYVNVSYRRELTLNSDQTDIVQLSVVDGGVLGGRRLEARIVGTDGVSRGSFDRLIDYATRIVNTL